GETGQGGHDSGREEELPRQDLAERGRGAPGGLLDVAVTRPRQDQRQRDRADPSPQPRFPIAVAEERKNGPVPQVGRVGYHPNPHQRSPEEEAGPDVPPEVSGEEEDRRRPGRNGRAPSGKRITFRNEDHADGEGRRRGRREKGHERRPDPVFDLSEHRDRRQGSEQELPAPG